jgi:protein-disulfide isomerase
MSRLAPVDATRDHIQGPLDAGIVMIEYGDFECPYCGEAYPELKAVKDEMGDALCFVFRHFPLRQAHPHAERAAEFAEAAASIGKFWEMHDLLYENQAALTDRDLTSYAKRLGLDAKLTEAALSGQFASRVQHDFTSGVRAGVNGTPCLFLNGERYDGPRDANSLIELMRGK